MYSKYSLCTKHSSPCSALVDNRFKYGRAFTWPFLSFPWWWREILLYAGIISTWAYLPFLVSSSDCSSLMSATHSGHAWARSRWRIGRAPATHTDAARIVFIKINWDYEKCARSPPSLICFTSSLGSISLDQSVTDSRHVYLSACNYLKTLLFLLVQGRKLDTL